MPKFYTITKIADIIDPIKRSKYIGGSDAPIINGIYPMCDGKPLKTQLNLYNAKKNPECVRQSDSNPASWGHAHEGNILMKFLAYRYKSMPKITRRQGGEWQEAEYPDGTKCVRFAETIHPQYPFIVSHPDMIVLESISAGADVYIVEAKSHSLMAAKRSDPFDPRTGYDFEDRSDTGLSLSTYIQTMFNLWVANEAGLKSIDKAFVAMLYDTNKMVIYGSRHMPIPDEETGEVIDWFWQYPGIAKHKKAIEKIQSGCINFWNGLHAGKIPEITPYDVNIKKVEKRVKTITGDDMIEARIQINNYHRASKGIKTMKAKQDDISAALKMLMGYDPEKPLETQDLTACNLLRAADGTEFASISEIEGGYKFNKAEQNKMEKQEPELFKKVKKYFKKSKNSIRLTPKKVGE